MKVVCVIVDNIYFNFIYLQIIVLLSSLTTYCTAREFDYSRQYVSVPDIFFDDPSALDVRSNLQSKQYHDFINTLYRYDSDNLQKVNRLFDSASANGRTNSHFQGRRKRAIYFRPLFVYKQQTIKKEQYPNKNTVNIQNANNKPQPGIPNFYLIGGNA